MVNEATLQNGIREHLARVQGLRSYAFAPSGTHGPLHGVLPTGWPDLLIIVPSERLYGYGPEESSALHFWFEVKTSRGKPTAGQPEMQDELREQGVRVEVIQSDDTTEACRQVERVLRDEGVVLREWE